jgi:hypothetical protein
MRCEPHSGDGAVGSGCRPNRYAPRRQTTHRLSLRTQTHRARRPCRRCIGGTWGRDRRKQEQVQRSDYAGRPLRERRSNLSDGRVARVKGPTSRDGVRCLRQRTPIRWCARTSRDDLGTLLRDELSHRRSSDRQERLALAEGKNTGTDRVLRLCKHGLLIQSNFNQAVTSIRARGIRERRRWQLGSNDDRGKRE